MKKNCYLVGHILELFRLEVKEVVFVEITKKIFNKNDLKMTVEDLSFLVSLKRKKEI